MMPNLSLSANSSATAQGGRLDARQNALQEGDWNINNAPNSSAGGMGMNKQTMMYVAIAAAAYWFIVKKKAA